MALTDNKFKLFCIIIILLSIFTTQIVIAADDTLVQNLTIDDNSYSVSHDDANDLSNVNVVENEKLSASNSDLLRAESGNFNELQQLINSAEENGIINLDKDYKYSGSGDANLIQITKPVIINGNGHSVDGDNQKLLFYIPATAHDVVLNNISLVNGYYAGNTGGLWILGPNCIINNTLFDNNNANSAGAAFVGSAASNTQFLNCNFTNNKGTNYGAAYVAGPNANFDNCEFTDNTGNYDGGIFFSANSKGSIVSNSTFTKNNGNYYSGAIYWSGSDGTVNNSTFTNNYANYYGGAIWWSASKGTVKDSTFNSNGVNAYGGAIYWTGSEGTIDNSTFTGNDANEGGAVYWSATYGTVKDSTFNSNTITGITGGGAISWHGDNGNVTGSEFNSNVITGDYGGAIYWLGNDGNIEYSNFTDNSAAARGGAVYIGSSTVTISDSKFKKNQAKWFGGAVYNGGNYNKISNSEFEENNADKGGAVYVSSGDSIVDSTFNANYATMGGAVYVKQHGFTIDGSEFNENTADNGGAVYWEGSNGKLMDSIFKGNSANEGGAVYLSGDGDTIYDSRFIDNNAADYGGAVVMEGADDIISKSTFDNNSAYNGGAVYLSNFAVAPSIGYDSTFTNNTADYGGAIFSEADDMYVYSSKFDGNSAIKGGAVNVNDGENAIIADSDFYNNVASEDGGAIYMSLSADNILVEWDSFENNTASYGGAIYNFASNNEIRGSTFTKNNASNQAGAIYNSGRNNVVDQSYFDGNHAQGNGGAILWNYDNGVINNSQFFNNDAYNGGTVYWNGNNGTINNSYLADSVARQDGGAVYWNGKDAHITGTGIHGNVAERLGGAVYFAGSSINAQVNDSKMNFNHAKNSGGAIYWDSADGSINGSEFTDNRAEVNGGAIYFTWHSENSQINDSNFEWNSALGNGGAIYWESKNGVLNNTKFDHNYIDTFTEGEGHGGAICWTGNNALVNNSLFTANTVYNEIDGIAWGGAIAFYGKEATVNNTVFEYNQANTNGGAISWLGSDGTLDNSTFYKNTAYAFGGAVFWTGSNALINNSDFINNTAEFNTGGGVDFETDGIINNSNFINNIAHKGGGVYWKSNKDGVINNSYFENNYARYGGAGISCDYDYPNTGKVIANSEFVKNTAHNYGGAIASLDTEIVNSTFEGNKAHLGGAIHSYSSKISDSTFKNNDADYGMDLYYYTEPVLENTDIPDSRIEVVDSNELVKIIYPIGNSTRMTNISYVAICVERYTHYPQYGSRDDTLRGLINIYTGESIADYLKILVYTYFNSTDDIFPHEGDNFIFYPETMRDFDDRWDYATNIPRPDYYSRAVHEFSDHDFWNTDHPVVNKVLELYKTVYANGTKIPDKFIKEVNGSYIEYDFTSMISPASQSLFMFNTFRSNMSIQKLTLNKTVYIGNQTMFKIVVTNNGETNLTNIEVNETEFDGLKLVNYIADDPWLGNVKTGKFLYRGTLQPGENASFIVIFDTFKEGNFTNVVVGSNEKTPNKTANNTTEVLKPLTFNVTKEWNDFNNQDGVRPTSITVQLLADGEVIRTINVTATDGWKASFKGLPIYKENTHIPISYIIAEVSVENYTFGGIIRNNNSFIIKNNHTPEVININVTKKWDDDSNRDGIRPNNITVNLIGDNELIKSVQINESNWSYVFTDLPKYHNGSLINYTILENSVSGYDCIVSNDTLYNWTVVNNHTPAVTNVTVNKTWNDSGDQDGLRPVNVTVHLLADGKEVNSTVLSKDNNWTFTFANLAVNDNGNVINYSVVEDSVSNYSNVTVKVDNYTFEIINTHTPDITNIIVNKKWNDSRNQDGLRPVNVTVRLFADGKVINSTVLSKDNNWTFNFTNLAVKNAGKPIVYIIKEDNVTGYVAEISDLINNTINVTNTHVPELTNITVNKIWVDNGDYDKIRPANVTVHLWADGKLFDSINLTAKDNWTGNFTDLPVNKDGKPIVYTITEDNVTGYNSTVNNFTVVNTHVRPDMDVVKLTLNKTVYLGEETSFTIVVTNTGNCDLTDISVVEEVPAGLRYDGKFSGKKWYSNGLEFIYRGILAPGDSISFNITFVTVKSGNWTNVVNATSNETENKTANNNTTVVPAEVNISKVWNDSKNQDGLRPANVTVHLFADGVEVNSTVLSSDNEWKDVFSDLPVYKDGKKIVYTVVEDKVDYYTVSVNETNDAFIITNTHVPYVINVTVNKTWDDGDNQDGLRPVNVTVHLFANGKEVNSTVLSEDNNWTFTFTDLAVNEDGKVIIYSVVEDSVSNYSNETVNVDNYTFEIINSHVPYVTDVTVNKTWDDGDNQDGLRPVNVTVHLLADGKVINTTVLSKDNNWTFTFTDLPVNEDGKVIIYSVVEDSVSNYSNETVNVDNYTFEIINSHVPYVTDVTVNKTWDDGDNQDGLRPVNVTVRLFADGKEVNTTVLSKDNNWTFTFTDLAVNEKGQLITYSVVEDSVSNYSNETVNVDNYTFEIINTHVPELVNVSVNKTWKDSDNQDGIRPSNVIIHLFADGKKVNSTVLSEDNNWTFTFTDLPVNEKGQLITYSVVEDSVSNYSNETVKVDNYTFEIINTHVPELVNVSVNKTWKDSDNQDGIRPSNVAVHLLADGKEVNTTVLSKDNNWTFTFTNLAVNEDGKVIIYSVVEDSVSNYSNETVKVDNYTFEIINTHVPELVNVSVTKKWNDSDNQDGIRPSNVTVMLFADGVNVKNATLSQGNDWSAVFNDLPANNDGKSVTYTVKEVAVDDYAGNVTNSSAYDFTVVNYHAPEVTEIDVYKFWDDADNQDGIRPVSVIVYLVADGEDVLNVTLTAEDGWKHSFTNLPVFNNGKKIVYSVREGLVESYLEPNISGNSTDGFVIKNPHVPEVTCIDVTKVWSDNDDQDGLRPGSVIVELLADGVVIKIVTLSGDNGWKHSFADLPVYKDGKKINYTISEVSVPDYTANITESDGSFVINNTHKHVYKPGMSVRKITLNESVYLGQQVEFVIVVANTGDCDLTGVYVIDNDFTEGIVFDHMIVNADWTFDGKDRFTYGKTLGVGESANFTVVFNTTSVGFKVNNVTAGNNVTNETVNSTNTTTVVNKTVPPKPEPPKPEPPVPVPPQPVPPSPEVPDEPGREVVPDKHATGNPVFVLVLVLFTLFVNMSRRRKQ